jgi:hypothetical protein
MEHQIHLGTYAANGEVVDADQESQFRLVMCDDQKSERDDADDLALHNPVGLQPLNICDFNMWIDIDGYTPIRS